MTTIFTVVAICLFAVPDIVLISLLLRTKNHDAPTITNSAAEETAMNIDVLVPVKVPEDDHFIDAWIEAFTQFIPGKGSRLIVVSNGTWQRDRSQVPEFVLVDHKEGAGAKAENLERGIALVNSDLVAIFDVDSVPTSTLDLNYLSTQLQRAACIQGAKVTKGNAEGGASAFCEYDSWIEVSKSETMATAQNKTGLFLGSNAFFRRETLEDLGFHVSTALENIDASYRLLRQGGSVLFDPKFVALESPPISALQLVKQRVRWYLGWGHICRNYMLEVFSESRISALQKLRWAGFAFWITFFLPLSFVLAVVFGSVVYFLAAVFFIKCLSHELMYSRLRNSPRLTEVFAHCLEVQRASLYLRVLWIGQLVLLDWLKSLAFIGLVFGTSSSWSPTEKTQN
ncbi:MAG: glycosyltransferase family 2 protein [Pseudomonadota bacterium]